MEIKQTIYFIVALMAMVLMGVVSAFADTTVVYQMTSRDGDGLQTIYYQDKQHVRVDMASDAGHNSLTMMKLGDKTYMIQGKVVQDLDQLLQMMAMMGKQPKKSHAKQVSIKYNDTGRTEAIAGITGKVYRFEERGKKHEVVLAKHQALQDAVLGSISIFQTAADIGMMKDDAVSPVQQDASIKSMGLLRLDKTMRLQSIDAHSIPSSKFTLPSKPQEMGGMGSLMQNMGRH